jgi:glycosyltransferase involved in cell wall biosynthesis
VRVLLVADLYPPSPGGLERHVARLAAGLRRAGHAVEVVTAGTSTGTTQVEGTTVHTARVALRRVPGVQRGAGRPLPPPWADRGLRRAVAAATSGFGPDVVHAHGWSEFAAVRSSAGRVPVVVTLHDYGLLCPMKSLLRAGRSCDRTAGPGCLRCPGSDQSAAKRVALAVAIAAQTRAGTGADRYLAVSSAVLARHAGTIPMARADVVPNFIDDWIGPPPTPPTPGRLLYVGQDGPHKGFAHALAVTRALRADGRDVTLDAVGVTGAGPGEAGVRYWGRLEGDDLRRRFHAASVTLVPGLWEDPCPTVAIESISAGVPVVGYAHGGLTDIVESGRSGVLVAPGSEAALLGAAAALLADPARLAAFRTGARRRAGRFLTATVLPQIVERYRQVGA